ncbi:hypothetical protein GCM10010219_38580 [Streptomyces netropsis]|nr:hypothetical protein GCM10010219_38580 [Streptomyces netropsis]
MPRSGKGGRPCEANGARQTATKTHHAEAASAQSANDVPATPVAPVVLPTPRPAAVAPAPGPEPTDIDDTWGPA